MKADHDHDDSSGKGDSEESAPNLVTTYEDRR